MVTGVVVCCPPGAAPPADPPQAATTRAPARAPVVARRPRRVCWLRIVAPPPPVPCATLLCVRFIGQRFGGRDRGDGSAPAVERSPEAHERAVDRRGRQM